MRFRLAGIPVSVQPGFFLTAVLLGATLLDRPPLLLTWVLVVFASVLLHELGHAFAFRSLGHASAITLYFFGGHTTARTAARLSPLQDVAVSLAGPAAGLALGGLVYAADRAAVLPGGVFADQLVRILLWVNVGWGVLNLLPILPMDGGRVMAALLRLRNADSADRQAYALSTAFALLGMVAALGYGDPWPVLLCAMFAFGSYQGFRQAPRGGPDAGLRRELERGFARLSEGEAREVLAVAEDVAARATEDDVRRDAGRLAAWSLLAAGDAEASLRRIEASPGLGASDPLLRGQALRAARRAGEALPDLWRAFESSPDAVSGRALVGGLLEAGDVEGAARLAESPRAAALGDEELGALCELLLAGERPGQALLAAERRFDRGDRGQAAWQAARASQHLGDARGASAWLRRAEQAGLSGRAHLDGAPELRPLLEHPEHAALRSRLV